MELTINKGNGKVQVTLWTNDLNKELGIVTPDANPRVDFTDKNLTGALLQAAYFVNMYEHSGNHGDFKMDR